MKLTILESQCPLHTPLPLTPEEQLYLYRNHPYFRKRLNVGDIFVLPRRSKIREVLQVRVARDLLWPMLLRTDLRKAATSHTSTFVDSDKHPSSFARTISATSLYFRGS